MDRYKALEIILKIRNDLKQEYKKPERGESLAFELNLMCKIGLWVENEIKSARAGNANTEKSNCARSGVKLSFAELADEVSQTNNDPYKRAHMIDVIRQIYEAYEV